MNQKKLGFPLVVNDGWPPYDVEHIWVESTSEGYRVKSIPFFIKGIAYGDIVKATVDSNGYVDEWTTLIESPNSTLWILEHKKTDIADKLIQIGCLVEIEQIDSLIAVNVPADVNVDILDECLKLYENDGVISVAVPEDRIGINK
jgi:hypothetical protein